MDFLVTIPHDLGTNSTKVGDSLEGKNKQTNSLSCATCLHPSMCNARSAAERERYSVGGLAPLRDTMFAATDTERRAANGDLRTSEEEND
ncbi:hypothetical protein NPIL_115331 [Nephila pilipes]|uniref:Uncharacterized protein n=1 Tax=Nephila pilipes TaxID=299642 RepID=A0A8X6P8U1_NEPPI|nr:hypothetical protein NPIL_115331 [Nephila pilipes]